MTDAIEYNKQLAKALQRLKKAPADGGLGVLYVNQGYKGTGKQAHRRQIFVRFANEIGIDLWLEAGQIGLGGVTQHHLGSFQITGTVEETYQEIVKRLYPLAEKFGPL